MPVLFYWEDTHAESGSGAKWPDESLLQGFRDTCVQYVQRLQKLSGELLALIVEALELPPDASARFFEPEGNQDYAKVDKYPVLGTSRRTRELGSTMTVASLPWCVYPQLT